MGDLTLPLSNNDVERGLATRYGGFGLRARTSSAYTVRMSITAGSIAIYPRSGSVNGSVVK